MGHQKSRNQKESVNSKSIFAKNNRADNYPSGDNSGGQTYLSLLPRVISSGIIVFSSAFLVSLITASIVTPIQNSDAAQQIQASIDTTTGYYANVTGSDAVNLDIVATPDGSTVVGKDTITTETNSPTGFRLYISTNSTNANSKRMVHTNGESYIPTVDGTLYNPTKLSMNTWGYSLESINDGAAVTGSSYFVGVPLLNSENLIQNYTEAAPTGSGATVDVYFGAKANTALPSGTYTSTVVYTVLAEGSPAYEGEVSVSPDHSLMNGGGTLNIATGVYTNVNDLGSISVSVGGRTCSNPVITRTGANGSINIACTLPNLSTQAVGWKAVRVSMPKFGKTYTLTEGVKYSIEYMQDMTPSICSGMQEATVSNFQSVQLELPDSRDGYVYTVRKLADGNCWMTSNLRLTFSNGYALGSDGVTLTELTEDNTDLWTQTTTNASGKMNWTGGGTTETSSNHTKWGSTSNPRSYTFGVEKSGNDDTSQYKGTLYNWGAATAAKGTFDTQTGVTIEDSICPKGWRLPVGTQNDKSWDNLVSYAGGNASVVKQAPYSIVRVGRYDYNSAVVPDYPSYAFYWYATSASLNSGYNFMVSATQLAPKDTSYKAWGYSIRCVAR